MNADVLKARLALFTSAFCFMLAACGDDGEGGNDTLLTGFSGLVILAIVVWVIVRALNKRS
jgi:hypothetical protein